MTTMTMTTKKVNGTGPVAGIGIATGALVGGGAVTSVFTEVIKEFHDTEKSFTELSEIFDSLTSGAYDLYDHVLHLHTILEGIATVLEDIDTQILQLASYPHTHSRIFSWLQEKLWYGRR